MAGKENVCYRVGLFVDNNGEWDGAVTYDEMQQAANNLGFEVDFTDRNEETALFYAEGTALNHGHDEEAFRTEVVEEIEQLQVDLSEIQTDVSLSLEPGQYADVVIKAAKEEMARMKKYGELTEVEVDDPASQCSIFSPLTMLQESIIRNSIMP